MKKSIRQGDLLFVPMEQDERLRIETYHSEDKLKPQKNGRIREGEATGHHHELEMPKDARVFRPEWGEPIVIVNKLDKPTTRVVHPEHGPVELESDTGYRVHIARE